MSRLLRLGLGAVVLSCGGCGESNQAPQAVPVATPPAGAPAAVAPAADAASGDGSSPTIKAIMVKLTKGPNSLTPLLGKELKADEPPWETIQGQTKEFAQLAAAMGKNTPPKGHMESWEKLTSAYAEWASDLDQAAQSKSKDAALEAHGKLAGSCMACHQEHREMRKGGGGPRGGPPPGFGPGGPPPGGGPPPE